MRRTYARLEMFVRWQVLVMRRRCNVVCKAQAIIRVLEVHVEKALISTIKGYAASCHGRKRIVIAHVGSENHQTRIEEVWPSNIGRGREGLGKLEQLVWSSERDHVGVHVNYLAELRLPP